VLTFILLQFSESVAIPKYEIYMDTMFDIRLLLGTGSDFAQGSTEAYVKDFSSSLRSSASTVLSLRYSGSSSAIRARIVQ